MTTRLRALIDIATGRLQAAAHIASVVVILALLVLVSIQQRQIEGRQSASPREAVYRESKGPTLFYPGPHVVGLARNETILLIPYKPCATAGLLPGEACIQWRMLERESLPNGWIVPAVGGEPASPAACRAAHPSWPAMRVIPDACSAKDVADLNSKVEELKREYGSH